MDLQVSSTPESLHRRSILLGFVFYGYRSSNRRRSPEHEDIGRQKFHKRPDYRYQAGIQANRMIGSRGSVRILWIPAVFALRKRYERWETSNAANSSLICFKVSKCSIFQPIIRSISSIRNCTSLTLYLREDWNKNSLLLIEWRSWICDWNLINNLSRLWRFQVNEVYVQEIIRWADGSGLLKVKEVRGNHAAKW